MLSFVIAFWTSCSQLGPQAADTWPYDLKDSGLEHALAATIAAQELHMGQDGPALLLAMAYVESRFDPTATSRVVDGRRITGSWSSRRQAGEGPWFCGVLQTMAQHSWDKCLEMRDINYGYREGVAELKQWLKMSHGNVFRALNGHGCGIAGLTNNCNGYGARVLTWARRLKRSTFI